MALESPTKMLGLSFRCEDLPNMDVTSLTDAVVIVKAQDGSGSWHQIGATEKIDDDLHPVFSQPVRILYRMEEQQNLLFEVWDVDTSNFVGIVASDDDLIGTLTCSLADIVGSQFSTLRRQLQYPSTMSRRRRRSEAYLTISADDLESIDNMVLKVQLRGTQLKKMDRFGKSDPYFKIMKAMDPDLSHFQTRIKSEVLKVTLEPVWQPFDVHFSQLSLSSDLPFRVEVWDWDKGAVSGHDLIGVVDIPLSGVTPCAQFELELPDAARRRKKDVRGYVVIESATIVPGAPIGVRDLREIVSEYEDGVVPLVGANGSFTPLFERQLACDMRVLAQGEQPVACHMLFMARSPILKQKIDLLHGQKVLEEPDVDRDVVTSVLRWFYGDSFVIPYPERMECIYQCALLGRRWGIFAAIRSTIQSALEGLIIDHLVRLIILSSNDPNKSFHEMVLACVKVHIKDLMVRHDLCQMLLQTSPAVFCYVSRLQFVDVAQTLIDAEVASTETEEEGELTELRTHLLYALENRLFVDMNLRGTDESIESSEFPMHRILMLGWLGPAVSVIQREETVRVSLRVDTSVALFVKFLYIHQLERMPESLVASFELAGLADDLKLQAMRDACIDHVVQLLTSQVKVARLLLEFGRLGERFPRVVTRCLEFIDRDLYELLLYYGETKMLPPSDD